MTLYNRYETDKSLENDGAWVDFGEGVKFKILSDQSNTLRSFKKRQQKKYRQFMMTDQIPTHIEDQINNEISLESLVGWEGVTDREGKPLPFSKESAAKLLNDLPNLRRDIILVSGTSEAFRVAEVQSMGKTSETL